METVIQYIWAVLFSLMDIYIVYQFMTSFFENCFLDRHLLPICYGFRCVATVFFGLEQTYTWVIMLVSFLDLIVITLGYHAKISKKMATAFLVFFIMLFSEAATNLLIGNQSLRLFERADVNLDSSRFVNYILLWLLLMVIDRFKNVKKNIKLPKTYMFVVVLMLCSSLALLIFICAQKEVNEELLAISLLLIFIAMYAVIYLYDSISKTLVSRTQSELLMRERMYYHKQSEILQKNYESTRQFRHDMGNKMQVLQQLAADGELKKVTEYIGQITEKLEASESYSQTGNLALDSILNYKLTQAEQKGIEIRYDIAIPEKIEIEDDDLVSILGNLLDNAIEAVELMEDNGYIDMSLRYETGCIFLNIRNSYNRKILMKNGKIQTRKKDVQMHGIGIQSVQKAVEKYHGMLDITYDEKEFCADVLMYV